MAAQHPTEVERASENRDSMMRQTDVGVVSSVFLILEAKLGKKKDQRMMPSP